MKTSLFLGALVFSANVFSAVDYSYCQKQFNTFAMPDKPCETKMGIFYVCSSATNMTKPEAGKSSFYPFELTEDGKIKPHPSMNYKNENGKEVLTNKDNGMASEIVITRNDKGEVTDVATTYNMKGAGMMGGFYGASGGKQQQQQLAKNLNSFERKYSTNVKLEMKNGKCIPSRVDTVNSIGDEARQDVNFDAKLCRNVAQFFKKNPEAASCFDKNLMESAQNIFDDYFQNNKDIYGESKKGDFTSPKPLKTKLKSDMYTGYGYPGGGAVGGMGVGMGMGMPGASTAQMLNPMMPSMDSILATSKGYPGMSSGFGGSPVISAMQILTICQGGGWGQNTLHDVIYDESVWKAQEATQADSSKNMMK